MNLGLGHLSELKAHLLNASLRSATTFDGAIAALGSGMAARLEAYCNRRFARVEADTAEFSADRDHLSLPRYPIEEITAVELRETLTTGWVDQGDVESLVAQILADSGVALLHVPLGGWADRLRLTYTGGYWYATSPAVVLASGTVAISSGAAAAAIVFEEAFEGVPAIACTLTAPDGATIIQAQPYEATENGFTARLSAATAESGYSLSWSAIYGGSDADASVLKQGKATLSAGNTTKAVTFAAAFDSAPVVLCNVVAPESGTIIASVPSLVTTAGFTALLGASIPASGYVLHWHAISTTAAAAAATLPTGATALPADLKLAWFLQCEHVWKLRDKLGLSVAESAKTPSDFAALASMQLVPEVEKILQRYRRFALT